MSSPVHKTYIKATRMLSLMSAKDKSGKPVPFSLSFVKLSDGTLVTWPECWLTSRYSKGATVNVMCKGEHHPKKVRTCLIVSFNGLSVYY